MILRRDFHLAGGQVLDRLIATAMAEFELERLAAECLTKNLMSEADAKNRNAGFGQRLHFANNVVKRGGITRTIRKKNSRWFVLQGVGSARRRWQNLNLESVLPQPAQDVVFHTVVEGDNGN